MVWSFCSENSKQNKRIKYFNLLLPLYNIWRMAANHADTINSSGIVLNDASIEDYAFSKISPLQVNNNDIVDVQYFSTKPELSDWIGAYIVGVNISASSPIKFGLCSHGENIEQSEYMNTGTSSLQFNLTNIRSDIVFHFFSNGFSHPIRQVQSDPIIFLNYNEPLRNRIVPTGDPGVFSLLWSSATSVSPIVKWGTTPGIYNSSVPATTGRIDRQLSLCGGVASSVGWHDLGLIHTVNITVSAVDRIYYVFGDDKTNDFSVEKIFFVPPGPGELSVDRQRSSSSSAAAAATTAITAIRSITSINFKSSTHTTSSFNAGTFSTTKAKLSSIDISHNNKNNNDMISDFARNEVYAKTVSAEQSKVESEVAYRGTQVVLMADLGIGASDSTAQSTAQVFSEACLPAFNTTKSIGHLVAQGEVDAVFLSGDLSYANGYLSNWDFFLDAISPIAGSTIFLSTVGNHESDWKSSSSICSGFDSGGECGLSVDLLPMPAPATKQRPYWSYDVGLIHFVGISTEHNYTEGSNQYNWLRADLAAVNRNITPWIILSGHRPAYVDSHFCCGWGHTDDSCNGECVIYSDVTVMQQLQTHIDPILFEFQVNLVFSGHFHNVQRQSAVYQGKTLQRSVCTVDAQGNVVQLQRNPQGTVHMVIGSAGNGPSFTNELYDWSEESWDNLYGYALVTAVNATYLQWRFIESSTNSVIDALDITQDFSIWRNPDSSPDEGTVPSSANGDEYNVHAQMVVLTVGVVILAISLLCAYIHSSHINAINRKGNKSNSGQHHLLDTTEHSANAVNSSGVQPIFRIDSDDDGVV